MKSSVWSDNHIRIVGPTMDAAGLFWQHYMAKNYGEDLNTRRDNFMGLTKEQWREFGRLHNEFVKKTYLSESRFKSLGEITGVVTHGNSLSIEEVVREDFKIHGIEPVRYFITRAKKR